MRFKPVELLEGQALVGERQGIELDLDPNGWPDCLYDHQSTGETILPLDYWRLSPAERAFYYKVPYAVVISTTKPYQTIGRIYAEPDMA